MPIYQAYFTPFTVRVDFSSSSKRPIDVTEEEAMVALRRFLNRLPKSDLIDLIANQAELDRVEPAVDADRCPACGHSTGLCVCQRVDEG